MQEIKNYPDELKTIDVWARVTTPFAFGGTDRNIKTSIDIFKLYRIADIALAVIINPNSKHYYIVDMYSGGTIGGGYNMFEALQQVAKDITSGTMSECKQQQIEASRLAAKAQRTSLDKFWAVHK